MKPRKFICSMFFHLCVSLHALSADGSGRYPIVSTSRHVIDEGLHRTCVSDGGNMTEVTVQVFLEYLTGGRPRCQPPIYRLYLNSGERSSSSSSCSGEYLSLISSSLIFSLSLFIRQ